MIERNIINSAFNFPNTPTRSLISLQSYKDEGGYNDRYDSFYIQSYRYFSRAEIVHTTTTVGEYDTLKVTFTPQGALTAGSSNREMVLRLTVNPRYHDT